MTRRSSDARWAQRVVGPEGETVSQLCDDQGNMTAREFREAMRKQVADTLLHVCFLASPLQPLQYCYAVLMLDPP